MKARNKLKLPNELFSDLIQFIPFNLKWIKIRTSKLFDLLLIKFQQKYLIYLIKLRNELIKIFEGIVKNLEEIENVEPTFQNIVMFGLNVQLDILYEIFNVVSECLVSKANEIINKQKEYLWPQEIHFEDEELFENASLIYKECYVKKRQIVFELYSFCLQKIKEVDQPYEFYGLKGLSYS
uniref:F-box domain-containing protein n=1 Tax=Meloidogyne hapla TaxID=6305 RepID=A0A1I8BXR8_MELHA